MSGPAPSSSIDVIVFAASLRTDSLNRKLAYPCIKRARAEFLSEPHVAGTDRVDIG
jgi:hypothetical protein